MTTPLWFAVGALTPIALAVVCILISERLIGRTGRDYNRADRNRTPVGRSHEVRYRHMPNSNTNREFVTLKSGPKRYVYRDHTREKKQWCVVSSDDLSHGIADKVLHFYEVEIQGNAYCVTRPATNLRREDETKVGGFLVTAASLKCWRKPAEERSTSQPYVRVTA